jgi:hypothetical protein
VLSFFSDMNPITITVPLRILPYLVAILGIIFCGLGLRREVWGIRRLSSADYMDEIADEHFVRSGFYKFLAYALAIGLLLSVWIKA